MRRSLLIVTIAALMLVVRVPARGDSFIHELFAHYADSLRRQAGIPGMVTAIIGPDGGIVDAAYGLQDIERSVYVRTDTPFHTDDVTQVFTASLLLRCAEEGRLDLDALMRGFDRDSVEANATVRQLLTHTSIGPAGLTFSYRPERLSSLALVSRSCTKDSFRETMANLLDRFAMRDSVPGPDAATLTPEPAGVFVRDTIERYQRVLSRLATPYAVDRRGRPTRSDYTATTLTASSGLVSTVRDLEQFDLALRGELLVRQDTLAASWLNPLAANGSPLPHAIGWFSQIYNGELVVWQFGISENISSSLVLKVPGRGLTLIMLANSDGLAKPSSLAAGDVTVSPFARQFLRLFVY